MSRRSSQSDQKHISNQLPSMLQSISSVMANAAVITFVVALPTGLYFVILENLIGQEDKTASQYHLELTRAFAFNYFFSLRRLPIPQSFKFLARINDSLYHVQNASLIFKWAMDLITYGLGNQPMQFQLSGLDQSTFRTNQFIFVLAAAVNIKNWIVSKIDPPAEETKHIPHASSSATQRPRLFFLNRQNNTITMDRLPRSTPCCTML